MSSLTPHVKSKATEQRNMQNSSRMSSYVECMNPKPGYYCCRDSRNNRPAPRYFIPHGHPYGARVCVQNGIPTASYGMNIQIGGPWSPLPSI